VADLAGLETRLVPRTHHLRPHHFSGPGERELAASLGSQRRPLLPSVFFPAPPALLHPPWLSLSWQTQHHSLETKGPAVEVSMLPQNRRPCTFKLRADRPVPLYVIHFELSTE
jgi:hypothetical protein